MENADRMLSGGELRKILLATLVVPFSILLVASRFAAEAPESELTANIYSTSLALCCWWASWRLLFSRIFGQRLFFTLTLLVLLRMAVNFLHFYFVCAPVVGIESSDRLVDANLTSDLRLIFASALAFLEKYRDGDVFYAVFGDYYRAINNPGVGILYGWLLSIFGTYATIAIPWAIIYSAFASLVLGLTGLSMALPYRHCRAVILLVFLMPGLYVFPPIYRDNFMVYLLALSGYTAVIFRHENILLIVVVVVVESILLYSLRGAYLLVPATFCVIALTMQARRKMELAMRGVALAILLIPVFIISWGYLEQHIDDSLRRFSGAIRVEDTYPILAPFKKRGPLVFFPAAAVFLLLTPMPWWQHASAPVLVYQVFSYGQTWYGLTAIVALVMLIRQGMISTEDAIATAFFVVLFLLTLLGADELAPGYVQIGIPFAMLASIRYLKERSGLCVAISTAIIVVAHTILLFKKF